MDENDWPNLEDWMRSPYSQTTRVEKWNHVPVSHDPAALIPYPSYSDDRYTKHGAQLVYGDYHAKTDESAYADRLQGWHGKKYQHAWLYAKKMGDDNRTARAWSFAYSYMLGRPCKVVKILAEVGGDGYPYYFIGVQYVDGPPILPLSEGEITTLDSR